MSRSIRIRMNPQSARAIGAALLFPLLLLFHPWAGAEDRQHRFNAPGNIVIADQFNNRAIIINDDKRIEFQYGQTNVAGNGPNQLDAPYTSFAVGDYTGQTPPPPTF